MSLPLSGMTIALVVPKTYDYSTAIQKELEVLGATVVRHEEWTEGVWPGLARRLGLATMIARFRQARFLAQLEHQAIDYLLVIRGSTLPASFLLNFKQRFSGAKRIMYQWDSEQNNDFAHLLTHFDVCASFDSQDCKRLGLQYLPLFYVRDIEATPTLPSDYDLCLIGAYTEGRYAFYLKTQTQAETAGLTLKVYFFQPLVAKIKDLLSGRILETSTAKLDRSAVYELMSRSRCILDVHHPAQSGLTMRTIETLALGKKLITTNTAIKSEAFYRPELIRTVDAGGELIDLEWLGAATKKPEIDHLRLDRWLLGLIQMSGDGASVQG